MIFIDFYQFCYRNFTVVLMQISLVSHHNTSNIYKLDILINSRFISKCIMDMHKVQVTTHDMVRLYITIWNNLWLHTEYFCYKGIHLSCECFLCSIADFSSQYSDPTSCKKKMTKGDKSFWLNLCLLIVISFLGHCSPVR